MLPYEYMDRVVLKRITRCKNGELFKSYPYLNTPQVQAAVERYYKSGYFRYLKLDERLNKLLVPDLKKLLRGADLPVSGKKSNLIQRVKESVSPAAIDAAIPPKDYIAFSEKGQAYYDSLCNRFVEEFDALVMNMYHNLLEYKFDAAYKPMCTFEKVQFFKRGLGIDWEREERRGCSRAEQSACTAYMNSSENKRFAALAICYWWFGSSNDYTEFMQRHQSLSDGLTPEDLHYGHSMLSNLRKLYDYRDENIEKYEIHTNRDEKTCDLCTSMSGKNFPVLTAKIGVNCPPFHKGCRCCIVSVIRYEDWTPVRIKTRKTK